MKADAMTIAAVIFVLGVVASSVSAMDVFQTAPEPVAALHQGITPS